MNKHFARYGVKSIPTNGVLSVAILPITSPDPFAVHCASHRKPLLFQPHHFRTHNCALLSYLARVTLIVKHFQGAARDPSCSTRIPPEAKDGSISA